MNYIWFLFAYLVGAIPTSLIVGKLFAGIDLREHGSKNLGATNVYRVLGWRYAIPVGAVDITKGAVPVALFASHIGNAAWIPLAMGVAAILGHVFSVFIRFKGGKGVATAAGAVLALAPVPVGIAFAVWAVTVRATGYVSLGSMLGALSFPVSVMLIFPDDTILLTMGVAIAAFILSTHRANISRLLAGTENRFGHKKGDA